MHPHDLAIDERVHDGRLSTGLALIAIGGRADSDAAHGHDHVIACRDQLDRLDRRDPANPLSHHVDHLLAVVADPLGLDALVDYVRR